MKLLLQISYIVLWCHHVPWLVGIMPWWETVPHYLRILGISNELEWNYVYLDWSQVYGGHRGEHFVLKMWGKLSFILKHKKWKSNVIHIHSFPQCPVVSFRKKNKERTDSGDSDGSGDLDWNWHHGNGIVLKKYSAKKSFSLRCFYQLLLNILMDCKGLDSIKAAMIPPGSFFTWTFNLTQSIFRFILIFCYNLCVFQWSLNGTCRPHGTHQFLEAYCLLPQSTFNPDCSSPYRSKRYSRRHHLCPCREHLFRNSYFHSKTTLGLEPWWLAAVSVAAILRILCHALLWWWCPLHVLKIPHSTQMLKKLGALTFLIFPFPHLIISLFY